MNSELLTHMQESPEFKRKVARRTYFGALLGSFVYILAVAGPRMRMNLWKLALLGYTLNPVAEYAGYWSLHCFPLSKP